MITTRRAVLAMLETRALALTQSVMKERSVCVWRALDKPDIGCTIAYITADD